MMVVSFFHVKMLIPRHVCMSEVYTIGTWICL